MGKKRQIRTTSRTRPFVEIFRRVRYTQEDKTTDEEVRPMPKTFTEYRDFYRQQLLEDVMPFWMNSDLLDREYGGCITSVSYTHLDVYKRQA